MDYLRGHSTTWRTRTHTWPTVLPGQLKWSVIKNLANWINTGWQSAYSALLELLAQLNEVLGDVGGVTGRPLVVDADRVHQRVQLGTELYGGVGRRHRLFADDHLPRHVAPASFQPPHCRFHGLRRLADCTPWAKKRATLFFTITPVNLGGFVNLLYQWKEERTLYNAGI